MFSPDEDNFQYNYLKSSYEPNFMFGNCFSSPTPFPNYNDKDTQNFLENTLISQVDDDKYSSEIDLDESQKLNHNSMIKLNKSGKIDPPKKNTNTKATSKSFEELRENNKGVFEEKQIITGKKKGRKRKEDKTKGKHNKFSEDNIIRKIKTKFLFYIWNLLNESLLNKNFRFLKIDSNISECLKKDFNISLFDTKIKDLFLNSTISGKYRKEINTSKSRNRILVNKIFEEGKETQVIEILNLTYMELFNIFRSKIVNLSNELKLKIQNIPNLQSPKFTDINKVFNEIYLKELMNNELEKDINAYIEKFKLLCGDYENWFFGKNGRNRKKNFDYQI